MHGFGLRAAHYGELLEHGAGVPFAEIISENAMGRGGKPHHVLDRVRRDTALAFHGVSMSIGGVDPLDRARLKELRALCERFEVQIVSEHLCFSGAHGYHGHDLWPLPHTEEAVAHVTTRLHEAQELLGRPLALENVSTYMRYSTDEMSELEFTLAVLERADCTLLLDVNNVFVNAFNHQFDASEFIDAIPADRIAQVHLAGHQSHPAYCFDDHASDVSEPVWDLYARLIARVGPVPTIIERDGNLPALEDLRAEARRAGDIMAAHAAAEGAA